MSILSASGSTRKTMDFLKEMAAGGLFSNLETFAQQGVNALSVSTPVDSGITAASWGYDIQVESDHAVINWFNTNEIDGVNIAVILQYGHATGTGGYITGIDYINPSIQPIFTQIIDDVWRKVTLA